MSSSPVDMCGVQDPSCLLCQLLWVMGEIAANISLKGYP